jgi:hypothetical protein
MAGSRFLHSQLRAYSDSWHCDHEQAMACWELEARLKLAITLHELIVEDDRQRNQAFKSNPSSSDRENYVRDLHSLYSEWFATCNEMLEAISQLEGQGYHVDGAERFAYICGHLRGVLNISADRIMQSLQDLDRGKFRPLAEIRNELRGRAGA